MSEPDVEALNHALGDLRVFIKQVEARGELMVVRDADPHLEIGALYELSQEADLSAGAHVRSDEGLRPPGSAFSAMCATPVCWSAT